MIWDNWTNIIIIYSTSALALIWAFFNAMAITNIKVEDSTHEDEESQNLKEKKGQFAVLQKVRKLIANGANAFLFKEYSVMSTFILFFGLVIFAVVDLWG